MLKTIITAIALSLTPQLVIAQEVAQDLLAKQNNPAILYQQNINRRDLSHLQASFNQYRFRTASKFDDRYNSFQDTARQVVKGKYNYGLDRFYKYVSPVVQNNLVIYDIYNYCWSKPHTTGIELVQQSKNFPADEYYFKSKKIYGRLIEEVSIEQGFCQSIPWLTLEEFFTYRER